MAKAKRSPAQRDQFRTISKQRHDKENIPPPSPCNPTPSSKAHQELLCKPSQNYEKRFRNERRQCQRKETKEAAARAEIASLRADLAQIRKATAAKTKLAESTLDEANRRGEALTARGKTYKSQIEAYQKTIRALYARCARTPVILKRAVLKARLSSHTVKLTRRGAFTPEARALMRIVVKSGCSQGKVGGVVQSIGKLLGYRIKTRISRRTVGRALLEGGLAAKMQLGFEMGQTSHLTISGDSTSHRKVNHESHHIAMRTPDYTSPSLEVSESSVPKVRFLSLMSTVDHASENSVAGWMGDIDSISDVFNNSPMKKRHTADRPDGFTRRLFASLLRGMNGDHAANEKCTAKLLEEWKMRETLLGLGEDRLMEKTAAELVAFLMSWNSKKIEHAGGIEVWNQLSPAEQIACDAEIVKELQMSLGEEEYKQRDGDEKRIMSLFIWAGCCMHKDQNCFEAGNKAAMEWWKASGNTPPILLANKHNAAVLRNILDASKSKDTMTDSESVAFEASTRGGAKTAAIAGAIFNNKDDKKGQGDIHLYHFMELVGKRFPDTNNTRFGSCGLASERLIIFREATLKYLLLIKYKKKSSAWTNIELNLYDALRDIPTLTELAAIVLYNQAVSHPYMRVVRGPGTEQTNVLELGEFHETLKEFLKSIIRSPDRILGSNMTHTFGSLDASPWESPEAIEAVQKLQPELPHLCPILVAFFTGSLETWTRFSEEFASGGLIDQATTEERSAAWMPSTNDANEGALGAFRVHMRKTPRLSLHQYNAMAMFNRNDTQSFIDVMFKPEDHTYTMKAARAIDASGLEAARRKAQVEFDARLVEIKQRKEAAKIHRAKVYREKIAMVVLVMDEQEIMKMTVPLLDDQLDALRIRGDDVEIPSSKKARGKKKEKQDLLIAAIRRHIAQTRSVDNLGSTTDLPDQIDEAVDADYWDEEDDEMEE